MAADLRLDLEVSEIVSGTPQWRSSSNAVTYSPISAVTFDFGAVISGYSATNVDSDARVIVLSDPTKIEVASVSVSLHPLAAT